MAQLHRSATCLRVTGDDLVPDEVTALLGAPPSHSRTKGEQWVGAKTGRVYTAHTGRWHLDTSDREPEDVEAQVREILGQLTDDLQVWTNLERRFEIDLFCGGFMEGGNESLSLSPRTLADLGARGITLALDIYGP